MTHRTSDDREVAARILVVDDHSDAAESMTRLLHLYGHEVQVAHDGPQAVATALCWNPEFILLEIGLPAMDGYEVAIRLKREASCEKAVLIAVTGYGQPEDRQKSRAAGIDHHLLKPVDPCVLRSLLSRPAMGPCAGGGSQLGPLEDPPGSSRSRSRMPRSPARRGGDGRTVPVAPRAWHTGWVRQRQGGSVGRDDSVCRLSF